MVTGPVKEVKEDWNPPCWCDNEEDFNLNQINADEVRRALNEIKKATAPGPDGITSFLLKLSSNEICENIAKIIKASINTATYPEHWKRANIKPVYKAKGSKSDASNYRPISLLPILARCFEKLVANQLTNFCNANYIIPKEQYGFCKHSNCEMALLTAVDGWCKAIDGGEVVAALMIDLSKAFDSVSHPKLLVDLLEIGCSLKTVQWFSSYLSIRQQRIEIQGKKTSYLEVTRGVPQGSSLSPLLFNIYLRNLPESINSDSFVFADDVTLSEHHKSIEMVKQHLSASFYDLKQFCESRELVINSSKTQFIIIKTPSKKLSPEESTLILDGISFSPLLSVKWLGFTIDRHLTFSEHINTTISKCRGLLGILRRISSSVPKELMLLMYNALIRTHLEYASSVFIGASRTQLQKLDIVQKCASRVISGLPRDAHAAPIMKELGMDSLTERRIKHFNELVSACIEGKAHPSLCELFKKPQNADHPALHPRTVIGRRAFSSLGILVFNSAPEMIAPADEDL